MEKRMWNQGALALVLAATIAGCGVSPVAKAPASTASASLAAQGAKEVVPSEAQLKKLEATSPHALVENAPLEPGMTDGFWPKPPKEDLGNFGKVEETLWRGARPSEKGLEQLKAMGVKTIVNFENDKKAVEFEKAWAEKNGVKFVSIPLSVITPPKEQHVDSFLKLANDESARPLYFHCMQGRDRTGTAAFSYRVKHDGWGYDKAYAEMKSYHFHTYLLGLKGFLIWYAHKYTKGAAPQPAPAN